MGAGVTQENGGGGAAALLGRLPAARLPRPPGFMQWVVADTSGRGGGGIMPGCKPPCPDARPSDAWRTGRLSEFLR